MESRCNPFSEQAVIERFKLQVTLGNPATGTGKRGRQQRRFGQSLPKKAATRIQIPKLEFQFSC
jgi:hypothetical protein